jgi:hypothetical protein
MEWPADFEERLQAGQNARPTVRNFAKHVRSWPELVMSHCQRNHLTQRFECNRNRRMPGLISSVRGLRPGKHEATRWDTFDDFAGHVNGSRRLEAAVPPHAMPEIVPIAV